MFEDLIKAETDHMEKAMKMLKDEYLKLRTGRASPTILDTLRVDYFGTPTPLKQMAAVSAPEARLIVIQPWDASAISEIEKAIQKSELGLSPQNDGKVIRLPIPTLTEERRKELVKVVNKLAEDCRVAIRNVRRTGMEDLKKAEKDKKASADDVKRGQTKIQEMTDGYIKKVDQLAEGKSKEILEV